MLKSNFYAIIMLLKGDLYMETTKFIRNVQEQNKENYFHNKSRFINTINQITNLSIPLDKNIIDVEYIAKKQLSY